MPYHNSICFFFPVVLVVEEAFPCQSLQGDATDGMNVEIDPVSELAVAETISTNNMRIVGWYHSHPLFQPDPSVRYSYYWYLTRHHVMGLLSFLCTQLFLLLSQRCTNTKKLSDMV